MKFDKDIHGPDNKSYLLYSLTFQLAPPTGQILNLYSETSPQWIGKKRCPTFIFKSGSV